jgi:primosomal protein N' (replication factor Y)
VGFGTERIEEEVETFLPDARIARMDLDSTRKKDSFAKLISRFSQGEIDVLIGTQMVTKGLDFDDVRLVGIVSADSLLHYPDFRAQERAFQLMEQVAGRAGRRNERGKVIIQTYRPMHHIIQFVEKHAYEEMAIQQLEERSVFNYPPYSRLIHISIRHKDKLVLDEVAGVFAASLRHLLGDKVLGPEYPPVSRLKNIYHKDILLKLSREVSPVRVKDFLWQLHAKIFMQPPYKSCRVVFDVDPY